MLSIAEKLRAGRGFSALAVSPYRLVFCGLRSSTIVSPPIAWKPAARIFATYKTKRADLAVDSQLPGP